MRQLTFTLVTLVEATRGKPISWADVSSVNFADGVRCSVSVSALSPHRPSRDQLISSEDTLET